MQRAKTLSEYKKQLREALNNTFLRGAMERFAVAYPQGRAKAFQNYDTASLIAEVARVKDANLAKLDELYIQFKAKAEANGTIVHLAKTGEEAGEIIARIAKDNGCRSIVKSKSMTAEEIGLNQRLERDGLRVTETDLGEWIIQLRAEGPSHMVLPAIHLSRFQVADLFSQVTREDQPSDIQRLVKVARRELRQRFAEADMGISGANFAIAESGTIGIVSNEGNARLVTTLPKVQVTLVGLDKLFATFQDALKVLRVLPRNATGQAISSYVNWIGGAETTRHIVFLDNGRRTLAKDPLFSQVLRCVRCGACANVCPVYRMVGGHQMGHIYIGAIGLILTYFFHGTDKAKNLVQNCINCGACKEVCAAGIDLPRLIKEIQARILDEEGHSLPSILLSKLIKNRKLFHTFLRMAKAAQRPLIGGKQYIRHLPQVFAKDHGFKALPAIAAIPFRDRFLALKPKVSAPRCRVAMFAGCVQDFVYPEQLEAALKVLAAHNVDVDFPMEQSCCGLPLLMMGEKQAGMDVARQNIAAMEGTHDWIVTLCASCASHLKNTYPHLLGENDSRVRAFSSKVVPFSFLMTDVLGTTEGRFRQTGEKATFHSPCHLCRGLGVVEQPRKLLSLGGYDFVPAEQERVCCGFGGTYSAKFPAVSEQILLKKLADAGRTGAEVLVTECPGCVMQLRGGAKTHQTGFTVRHMAEVLADHLK